MSPSVNEVASNDPSKFNVEFRSHDDEAWYSVRVVLEREVLRIKFLNFGDGHDKVFEAQCFSSLTEVEEFKKRFRPASLQLQDGECRCVRPGTTVCACYRYSPEDIRFYDANVWAVQEKEHSFNEGEEECLCTFALLWLHGPIAGIYSQATIADMCKIQPTSGLDPVVASFLKIAWERTEVTAKSASFSIGESRREVGQPCNGSLKIKPKRSFLECLYKETRCARRSISEKSSPCENRIVKLLSKRLEDRDLGGKKIMCMILVGNMDKMLSPQTIEEFLHRHASVSPKVYIFPSLSWELFTRGAFVLDCERDFSKLHNFLKDPTLMITSSTGRPWVIIDEVVGLKDIKASIGTLMHEPKRKFRNSVDSNGSGQTKTPQKTEQIIEGDDEDGFLKLSRTQEWILGDNTAPMNKKAVAKAPQDSSEQRKKLDSLKYESLKREILLLSVGIGVACSGYCLITLSVQAAVSYAIGVLFSCLYLQLLYQHADNLSSEDVPQVFMKKKSKKIGIRSEDLQDLLERSIKGIGISLSSPRLVIPAAIFGLWVLSHQYIADEFFDFQIVPAIFGMLVYKAAVLVQVYRDNEDLQFVFPENKESSSD